MAQYLTSYVDMLITVLGDWISIETDDCWKSGLISMDVSIIRIIVVNMGSLLGVREVLGDRLDIIWWAPGIHWAICGAHI